MRTLLLTLTTCLLALPANAKYSGGSGTAQDPYRIATAADLIALGETPADYDKHFLLTADIDLDPNLPGRKVFDKAVIAPGVFFYTRISSPYEVSRSGTPFAGVFNGNGHTIWHLTIKTGGTGLAGLFGILRGEVRNLGVAEVNMTGSGRPTGGLVADNEGTVTECYGSGTVSGTDPVGGLVGVNYGSMARCHSMSTINGNSRVGGLVGINGSWDTPGASVTRCYSTGVVSGGNRLGGLVGENGGVVTECCSSGLVSGTHDSYNLGGLVGQNWIGVEIATSGRVENSYSSAIVEGTDFVGGLVGYNGGTVTQCYSTGAVSGKDTVGGLVGCAISFDLGITYFSFWDAQTSRQAKSIGGTGKTTAEMQKASTFLNAGWDFVGETKNGTKDIWWILEGQDYPRLAWERVVSDDFADGKAGPLWTAYEPQPERVRLREVHGRLEVEAAAQEESVDAFYASNGWRLKVSQAFALRVDFHFGKEGTGNGRMNLGLVPSLDPAGMRWAEFEAGCFDIGPIYLYEVRDGDWVEEQVTDRSSDSGTLYMSYNPDTDELYFSMAGYGKPNAWKTVRGLLKGRWAGGPVYVILSGGSAGMALTSGDAWFDNFTINAGVIVR